MRVFFGLAVSSFGDVHTGATASSFLPSTVFFVGIVLLLLVVFFLFLFLLFGRERIRFWDFPKVGEFSSFGGD